jgi:Mn2+/Fe2+ NRAMP family transporter
MDAPEDIDPPMSPEGAPPIDLQDHPSIRRQVSGEIQSPAQTILGSVAFDSGSDDDGWPLPSPKSPGHGRFEFSWRKLWRFCGPGFLMSLAYLDPGNLESDVQQGAYTGLSLLWVMLWAHIMGFVLQEACARLGIVSGIDLAQAVRMEYPRWLNYVLYVNMEIAVIGADIQEVVGTSIAINLLSAGRVPVWMGCLITTLDTFSFLAVQRLGVRYLEGVIFVFIGIMCVCFFVNWSQAGLRVEEMVRGLIVPSCPTWGVAQAVGTVGAVIMPHNLYLHSGLVLSRRVERTSSRKVLDAICYNRIECAASLLVAFLINVAVVATNSAMFYTLECASADDEEAPMACLAHGAIAAASYWQVGAAYYGATHDGTTCYSATYYGTALDGTTCYSATYDGSTHGGTTCYSATYDGTTCTHDGTTCYGATHDGTTYYGATYYGATATHYGATYCGATYYGRPLLVGLGGGPQRAAELPPPRWRGRLLHQHGA